jgi:hypothetical protein
MIIDKSWTRIEHRGSKEFLDGLAAFLDHCKPLLNSSGNIKCPCRRCRNVPWVSLEGLKYHIGHNGWDPTYTQWKDHGEPDPPNNDQYDILDNTTQREMSDMGACLNDILDIPPNNDQNDILDIPSNNEPTHGNIGETSNKLMKRKVYRF